MLEHQQQDPPMRNASGVRLSRRLAKEARRSDPRGSSLMCGETPALMCGETPALTAPIAVTLSYAKANSVSGDVVGHGNHGS